MTGRLSLALLGAGAALAGWLSWGPPPPEPAPLARVPGLAERILELSEPGGYFDTDNLISNETSFLQVSDTLEELDRRGGAYIGVGPEQNFSYIARLRPSWAFIVDVRRDNALQHLYFNALFHAAEDPFQYLCRLLSRPCPERTPAGARDGVAGAIAALEAWPPDAARQREVLAAVIDHVERGIGFPLDDADRAVLERIHATFFRQQLALRFRSHGRRPMPYHPTLGELLLARSPSGRHGSFLDSQQDYDAVRALQQAGRVVPVVGDFGGRHALRAVARFLREQGETVSAYYVSNVEFYLLRDGGFEAWVENVRALPRTPDSLFIRAYFDYGRPHPDRLTGHRSTTVAQPMDGLLARADTGGWLSHWELATGDTLH